MVVKVESSLNLAITGRTKMASGDAASSTTRSRYTDIKTIFMEFLYCLHIIVHCLIGIPLLIGNSITVSNIFLLEVPFIAR